MRRMDPERYVGNTYGSMTVLSFAGRRKRGTHNEPYLSCKCTCGEIFEIVAFAINRITSGERSGRCKKCAVRSARSKNTKHGATNKVGKRSRKYPTFKAWCGILKKCRIASLPIEPKWLDFNTFYKDMKRPGECHKLWFKDRKLGMVEGNIFWKPPAVDINWRKIKFQGETKSLIEWSLHFGIKHDTIRARIVREFDSAQKEGLNPLDRLDYILDIAFTCSTERGNVGYEAEMTKRLVDVSPVAEEVVFEPRVYKIR